MRRSSPLALAVVTALLTLAACSTSGSDAGDDAGTAGTPTTAAAPAETTTSTTAAELPDDPDQAVADAVDTTLENPAFSVQSEANLDVEERTVVLSTEGSLDYDARIADVRIAIDGGEGQQGDVRLLADGEHVWVAPRGDVGVTMADGKEWAEGEADRLSSSDFEPVDLVGVIVALRAADGTELGGTEEIDGVEAQEYTTTVTYEDAVDAAGSDADAFQSSLSLTADEPVDLDIHVWIGPDGIIRRFELTIDAPAGVPLGGDYTVELSDVGDEIEPPDAPDADTVLQGPEAEDVLDQLLAT
ncbi:MAG: hypothetical protein JWM47_1187 [Acidimicrobiales bacterium]|nr:hypothetical protein [Acidimicrobiales bacterium]